MNESNEEVINEDVLWSSSVLFFLLIYTHSSSPAVNLIITANPNLLVRLLCLGNNSSPEFEQPFNELHECSNELFVLLNQRLYKLPQENADLLPKITLLSLL